MQKGNETSATGQLSETASYKINKDDKIFLLLKEDV
jgi:hypothetical protein